jgi:hypothetical protein
MESGPTLKIERLRTPIEMYPTDRGRNVGRTPMGTACPSHVIDSGRAGALEIGDLGPAAVADADHHGPPGRADLSLASKPDPHRGHIGCHRGVQTGRSGMPAKNPRGGTV